MNKVDIAFLSKRSDRLLMLKRPSGKKVMYLSIGKVCDLYYRGFHVSHLIDLWKAWLDIKEVSLLITKRCARYEKIASNPVSKKEPHQILTFKFSNSLDSALIKLFLRFDVTMSMLDQLVLAGLWNESQANREAHRLFAKIESLLGKLISLDCDKTRLVDMSDKASYEMAVRSSVMLDYKRFGWSRVRRESRETCTHAKLSYN